ncbi:MAG: hypothetical protein AAFY31_08755 [Pseudomonadota bacterium]
MKRFVVPFLALLAPAVGHAACTGDVPGGGVLNVYHNATTTDGVVGGISANQCGLEVTDFCTNGRCLAFFDGLSGYIDVSGLRSGTLSPAPAAFEYQVDSVDGSLSFMGRSQPFQLNGTEPVRITPAADHVLLSLPDPLPKAIRMTSTGSSGWEAVLPDWVGVPIPVTVYLDRLSAPEATLELFADHQMLKMDMRLKLVRLGELPETTAAPLSVPATGGTNACDETYKLAVSVGEAGVQSQINAFYAAVAAVGITDWDKRTEAQCTGLLAALETVGISNANVPTVAPPQQSCDELSQDLRPILRGPDSGAKRAVLARMVALGITAFDPTNPKHCAEISAALGR